LSQVVKVAAQAAAPALQRSPCIAFARGEDDRAVHLAVHGGERGQASGRENVLNAQGEWKSWFESARHSATPIIPLPRELASCLNLLEERPAAAPWLIPIVRDGVTLGGLVILSETNEPTRLAEERDSLTALCSAVALGIEMARAHASARRLAEDLAESNRRLQQAQVQLLRTRTLSMIAEMASGAAHELNSPLTVISGRAQLLSDLSDNPEAQRALEVIRTKAHECSRIVTELMDFARPRDPERGPVDLAELIGEARGEFLTQSRMPASSFTVSTMPQGLPPAHIDRGQIKSVLSELINNAADAISDRPGRIAVNCRLETSDEVIEVMVRDNGVGMTPAVMERAFDPFFSHRKAGRRRGFGLARAHRIVEAHGGRIWLESRPDEGTTAHVILPVAAAAPTAGRS
jgi:signal transduction histidine kinase